MPNIFTPIEMTDEEYSIIANYIEKNVGIRLNEGKRVMMQSRLISRLRALGMSNFSDYINFVFSQDASGQELIFMTNALTTNKTDFFREADHFETMTNIALPELIEKGRRDIHIWSSASSSGEEPYTLAMVMSEYKRTHSRSFNNYDVLGTDISTEVLDKAVNAVYTEDVVAGIPMEMKKRYFLKSRDPEKRVVRIKPALRSRCSFQRLNLMDEKWDVPSQFEIIFCRNVLIYFDKPTQEKIIRHLLEHLIPGGFLFLGHSETVFSMNLPLKTIGPTAYRKEVSF